MKYEDRNQNPQQHHLQDKFVDRKQSRANQVPLRPQAAGNHHRTTAALQDLCHLGLFEGAAEFRFLVLDLRAQVLAKFSQQVLLPIRSGQPEAHRLQVAIDKFR